jgi:hypothetical protein
VAASGHRHCQTSNPGRTFAPGALPRGRPLRVTAASADVKNGQPPLVPRRNSDKGRMVSVRPCVGGWWSIPSQARAHRGSRCSSFVVHALPVHPSVSESLNMMMMTRALAASAVALALGLLSQTGADAHGSPDSRDGHPALYLSCRGCQSTGLRRSRLRWWERPLKRLTLRRPYRCLRCQWRGWLKPPKWTLARALRTGCRQSAGDEIYVRHQLLILNRSRKRSPNLPQLGS